MNAYINFFGLNVPAYGLCVFLAIALCTYLSIRKALLYGFVFEDIVIVSAISIGAGLISGAFLYVIVSFSPSEIYTLIKTGDFIFAMSSGLVFYGALLGGLIGGLMSAYILKMNIGVLEICIVPYLPLGHAIGRIGCLLAGCCYGFKYRGFFSVKNISFLAGERVFPIQLVESMLNLSIMFALIHLARKKLRNHFVLCCYLLMYSGLRFVLEFFREDENRGFWCGLSTSQWISAVIFVVCIVVLLRKKASKSYN